MADLPMAPTLWRKVSFSREMTVSVVRRLSAADISKAITAVTSAARH